MSAPKRSVHYTLGLALGSAFTVVCVFGTALVGLVIYLSLTDFNRKELAHRLSHASGIALMHIDPEKHEQIQGLEDEKLDYFSELKAMLRHVQLRSDDVAYVYTVRLVPEGHRVWASDEAGTLSARPAQAGGEVAFVVDADPDPESTTHPGQVYDDAPAFLRDTLLGTVEPNEYGVFVSPDFYTDQWGTFLSGYIPIRDRAGTVRGMLCTDISAAAVLAHERQYKRLVLLLCGVVALITIPVGLLFASWIRRPLRRLGVEMDRIATLDLDHEEVIGSRITEVDEMGRELDNMKRGLRSFRKYVPARLVRQLMDLGVDAELGGHKEEVSILFSDIADFTAVSEQLEPEVLVEFLGEYLSTVTETLLEHGATVDKYIGDSVMAFWNAPRRQTDHAYLACKAALDCVAAVGQLNARWREAGHGVVFHTRFGVHTGETIVGNLGSTQRMAYTIVGDNVNLASRLEGANKMYGTTLLVSGATYELVRDRIVGRRVDRVAVKGKRVAIDLIELVGLVERVEPDVLERTRLYDRGFASYVSGRFSEAANDFQRVLDLDGEDGPAQTLLARCGTYMQDPRPKDWDGSQRLTQK